MSGIINNLNLGRMIRMVEFKIVISDPKTGKSYQREVKDQAARPFLGLKIGATVRGELIDLTGYEFLITGGSDYCGFPMRRDLPGTGRKKILAVSGVGLKKKGKGQKQRKTVCGNTIHEKIAQINLKIVKEGKEKLGKEEAPKEEKKVEVKEEKAAEEKPAEKKAEEKKEEAKVKVKKEPKKEA